MKKLAVLIILALAACVAYVALSSGGADAGLSVTHYKCYQARHAKRSPRFQATTVFLTDQFRDNVEVNVIKLNTHCSEARQVEETGSAAGFPFGLNCYAIRDVRGQERFRPQNIDVSDKLANLQKLTVSKVQSLCVQSTTFDPQVTLEGEAFVCYQAKTAKGQPRFQQTDRHIFDQLGDKDVRILRPVAYCSQSEKKVDAPNDDFDNGSAFSGLPNPNGGGCESVFVCDIHLSTVHTTLEDNDPIISCKTEYSHSVWFDWSGPINESLILDTVGSTYDTVIAVFTGDKSELAQHEVGCNDNLNLCQVSLDGQSAGCGCPNGTDSAGCCQAGTAGGNCCEVFLGSPAGNDSDCEIPASYLQFDAWAGTTYHILVASSDGHGGKLKFHIRAKDSIGDADSCGDPYTIGSLDFVGDSDFIHLSTMNAGPTAAGAGIAGSVCISPSNPDPDLSCAGQYGASVWFTYSPPVHQQINFDTTTSSYPTAIAVYDAIHIQEVACGGTGYTSAILKTGHKYLIMVGSTDAANDYRGGKLKLFVEVKDQLLVDGQNAGVVPQREANSLTCYQVRQARHRTETDELWDQFSIRQLDDPWLLTIGGVDSLCVPSNKDTCTRYVTPTIVGVGDDASLCYD